MKQLNNNILLTYISKRFEINNFRGVENTVLNNVRVQEIYENR